MNEIIFFIDTNYIRKDSLLIQFEIYKSNCIYMCFRKYPFDNEIANYLKKYTVILLMKHLLDVYLSVSHYLLFYLYLYLLFLLSIHKRSSAIYRIADHTSIGNIQRMMGTNPISYNTYVKMTHKERKEKSKHT